MKRTVMISSLLALVVVVAFSVLLATRHPVTDAADAPSALLGKSAPALSGRELGGGRLTSTSERGHIVVVNFWASWCGPCTSEAADLSTFAWQERNRNVKVVGVVFNDSLSAAVAFARHYGSLYPSLIDPNGAIANSYGVTSPPTTFVIDAKGRVVVSLLGQVNLKQLDAVIKRVQG